MKNRRWEPMRRCRLDPSPEYSLKGSSFPGRLGRCCRSVPFVLPVDTCEPCCGKHPSSARSPGYLSLACLKFSIPYTLPFFVMSTSWSTILPEKWVNFHLPGWVIFTFPLTTSRAMLLWGRIFMEISAVRSLRSFPEKTESSCLHKEYLPDNRLFW